MVSTYGPAGCRVTPRPDARGQELPKLVLRVPGGMKGACTSRGSGPEAMSKARKGWEEKKRVHPPLVTVSFLQALVEAGAGVVRRLGQCMAKCRCHLGWQDPVHP